MNSERQDVLHSWCVQSAWDAPTIVGGAGAHFWDAAGRRYLDLSSLAECMNLGHQHPTVVRAIQEQAGKLCFITAAWGAQPRAALARGLLERSGFEGGRVYFTLGGADANEHAVKFSRQASGKLRGKIVARDRSYHGASFATMALSGDARTAAQSDAEAFGVLRVPPAYAYRCAFGSADARQCGERSAAHVGSVIDAAGAETVAAVLMEPNAGTNGIVAPPNYWPLLRAETARRGVHLIADEVMSGFGRCGEWFAWQRHGEAGRPDLMSLAKGLTGAHVPLGAVVLSGAVAARLEDQMLLTGLTYCGHPLACAAGVAALQAYADEGLIERSRALGRTMYQALLGLQQRHRVIGDVRGGDGLFAVLELVADREARTPLAPWPDTPAGLRELNRLAREAGLSIATRGNLIILAPPLVIAERDLADAIQTLDRLFGEIHWP